MIFLIGSQKSGTTWLRDCFAHVCPVPKREWYFVELYEKISQHIQKFGHLADSAREIACREVMAATWKSLLDSADPCAIFDKSAYPCTSSLMAIRNDLHPFAVRLAHEVFPTAKTIVIVRDPRAVLNSAVQYLNHFRSGWGDTIDPVEFGATWRIQNSQWLSDSPSVMVRYEELKADFIGTLSRVFSSCEIRCSAEIIEKIQAQETNIDAVRPRQPEIYRLGLVDDYKMRLSQEAITKLEDAASPLMTALGYF